MKKCSLYSTAINMTFDPIKDRKIRAALSNSNMGLQLIIMCMLVGGGGHFHIDSGGDVPLDRV